MPQDTNTYVERKCEEFVNKFTAPYPMEMINLNNEDILYGKVEEGKDFLRTALKQQKEEIREAIKNSIGVNFHTQNSVKLGYEHEYLSKQYLLSLKELSEE